MHDFIGKVQEIHVHVISCTVEPESWVKLLVRIRGRIEIVYINIVFVSALVDFAIAVLSWLMLPGPGRLPGSRRFPFEQPKKLHVWALAREWVLACPGHYGNTKLNPSPWLRRSFVRSLNVLMRYLGP